MKKKLKRLIEMILGIFLILLGIAGLFLPFLQGILFILMGTALVSPHHGKKIIRWLREKWYSFRKK